MISRAPWLERVFGFDELTRIHRIKGFVAFVLVSVHIPLVIAGNSLMSGSSFLEQFRLFQDAYRFIPLAIFAHILLTITIASSIVIVRKRLKYELWYLLHFLNYVVIILALAHQLTHGTTLAEPWFRGFWLSLHAAVAIHLLMYRFVRPFIQYMRHRFYVERVVRETDSVVSIYISGRNMEKFVYAPGQFLKWRFLQKGMWGEEHPFTISQAPNATVIRCTVKSAGDYTTQLASLMPGTRAIISGPFGRFTLSHAQNSKLLFVAGGIGITPLRAMIEGADASSDIVLVYSAQSAHDFPLKSEIDRLSRRKNLKVHYVLTAEERSDMHSGRIDFDFLHRHVPDVAQRVAFICGPAAMNRDVESALQRLGVSPGNIHIERFSL